MHIFVWFRTRSRCLEWFYALSTYTYTKIDLFCVLNAGRTLHIVQGWTYFYSLKLFGLNFSYLLPQNVFKWKIFLIIVMVQNTIAQLQLRPLQDKKEEGTCHIMSLNRPILSFFDLITTNAAEYLIFDYSQIKIRPCAATDIGVKWFSVSTRGPDCYPLFPNEHIHIFFSAHAGGSSPLICPFAKISVSRIKGIICGKNDDKFIVKL